ncbi:MAG TPA: hypothetical protein VMN60_09145 [Longimicrobiales bacterium]|nr:hypothetical protein [Longimicrobiales bacterium]
MRRRGDRTVMSSVLRVPRLSGCLVLWLCACGSNTTEPPPIDTPQPPHQPPRDSVVMIDQGHNNFHTVDGRYAPFANALRTLGYTVRPYNGLFRSDSLATGRTLVISNALAPRNASGDWSLPTPSAFTAEEIATVRAWVEGGGSLLLIADHMPFPGAASELALVFGLRFNNGFALDTTRLAQPVTCLEPHQIDVFRRADGSLREHEIVNGRTTAERVDSVGTFTGQAFQVDTGWEPLLVFGRNTVSLMPDTAWIFNAATPRVPVEGWAQGAVRRFGSGRIAAFGEAAMFSEQTCGSNRPMGMNAPAAAQNRRLLGNLIAWLTAR